ATTICPPKVLSNFEKSMIASIEEALKDVCDEDHTTLLENRVQEVIDYCKLSIREGAPKGELEWAMNHVRSIHAHLQVILQVERILLYIQMASSRQLIITNQPLSSVYKRLAPRLKDARA